MRITDSPPQETLRIDDFSLEFFRDAFLAAYQEKYPERRLRGYVAAVNEILAEGGDYERN
jgi:hypothetical protein